MGKTKQYKQDSECNFGTNAENLVVFVNIIMARVRYLIMVYGISVKEIEKPTQKQALGWGVIDIQDLIFQAQPGENTYFGELKVEFLLGG